MSHQRLLHKLSLYGVRGVIFMNICIFVK